MEKRSVAVNKKLQELTENPATSEPPKEQPEPESQSTPEAEPQAEERPPTPMPKAKKETEPIPQRVKRPTKSRIVSQDPSSSSSEDEIIIKRKKPKKKMKKRKVVYEDDSNREVKALYAQGDVVPTCCPLFLFKLPFLTHLPGISGQNTSFTYRSVSPRTILHRWSPRTIFPFKSMDYCW
jgi:DNA primase catalytic subunit